MKRQTKIGAVIEKRIIQPVENKRSVQLAMIALFVLAGLFTIFAIQLAPERVDVRIGQRSPQDIYATKTIEDEWTTEALRDEAANSVESQYSIDPEILNDVKEGIERSFLMVYEIQEDQTLTMEERVEEFRERSFIRFNDSEEIQELLNSPMESVGFLENYLYELSSERLNRGIRIDEVLSARGNAQERIRELEEYPPALIEFAVEVIQNQLRANEFIDLERTEELRQQAIDQVDSVIIRQDDLIVREGERITQNEIEVLRELGMLHEEGRVDFLLYGGVSLIVLSLFFTFVLYLYYFHRSLLKQPSKIWMIALINMLTLGGSLALSAISMYVVPLTTNAMLLSILINPQVAIISNIVLSISAAVVLGSEMNLLIMLLIGGTMGALFAHRTQQRGNIFITGIVVAVTNFIVILAFGLISSRELLDVFMRAGYGGIGGIFAAVLTIGTLPFWEWGFSILTHLKLLELSNPNQKLLKKLLIEAPGTYHHSIIVGNLSESAADAVGGNGLLTRVGAFYHDIGKTKRPYFFKENQLGTDNPHNKLSPSLSSLIITGHVKDGIEIAKKHKLHPEIIDFIQTHHGNTMVAYFYHKAKETREEGEEPVDDQNFRYSGPKPQTKETAIVMLADSVEAAIRSIQEPTKEKVESLIGRILQGKLDDGQLEESNLTLKELKTIKEVFINTMLGIFHERIEYPEEE